MSDIVRYVEELFTPTPAKILTFLVVALILLSATYSRGGWEYEGLPLPVYEWGGPNDISRDHATMLQDYLVFDVILWYVLSCLLTWILQLIYKKYLNLENVDI